MNEVGEVLKFFMTVLSVSVLVGAGFSMGKLLIKWMTGR